MNIVKSSLLLITCLTTLIGVSYAQDYQQLEWDIIGISPLIPTSNDIGNAVGFHTEVRYNVNNNFSVGLNYNWQFFDSLFDEPIRGLGITTSYALTADYYVFNHINQRAFAGLSLGSFDNPALSESGIELGGSGLGLTPRIGYKLNFIRCILSYNYTFKDDFPNYFTLGLGLNIGGRCKK